MNTITGKAYAKINLGLDVLRRREDGYHEVKMIMQTVDLYDVLTFTKSDRKDIAITTDKTELPGDENNIIYKAAKLLMECYSLNWGITIDLRKNIPMAAGMAGGSTDAAAVFHGMNKLYELNLTKEELCRLAVKIGADVPYCIQGGTMLAEGIGEILTKLPDAPNCCLLIAKPDIDVSSKFVYENLHADRLAVHPDIDGIARAIGSGNLYGITERMGNVLETVTVKEYPVIDRIKNHMKESGALEALMSGSGPTVFGIYENLEKAEHAKKTLIKEMLLNQVYVTAFVNAQTVEREWL